MKKKRNAKTPTAQNQTGKKLTGKKRAGNKMQQRPNAALASLTGFVAGTMRRNIKQICMALALTGLVAAGAGNALFLQEAKHPNPYFDAPLISSGTVASIEKTREIRLDEQAAKPEANPLVMEIQRHLAARGYYDSTIDGLMGARTRAAIGLYQRAFKEEVTNKPSRALLEHIRLSPPDAAFHAAARKRLAGKRKPTKIAAAITDSAEGEVIDNPDQIKKLQRALSDLGFNDVTDDGVVGPITRAAVKKFKQRRGIGGDGTITAAVFDELVRMKKL